MEQDFNDLPSMLGAEYDDLDRQLASDMVFNRPSYSQKPATKTPASEGGEA